MTTNMRHEREKEIMYSIVARLGVRWGIRLYRRNVGAFEIDDRLVRCAEPGQSDLWGWLPASHGSRHVEIEVKRPGNRPTPKQLDWLRESTAAGAVAFWVDSVEIAERVAEAVLAGGRVVWRDGDDYDVEL